jgi:hypothetical protein
MYVTAMILPIDPISGHMTPSVMDLSAALAELFSKTTGLTEFIRRLTE